MVTLIVYFALSVLAFWLFKHKAQGFVNAAARPNYYGLYAVLFVFGIGILCFLLSLLGLPLGYSAYALTLIILGGSI